MRMRNGMMRVCDWAWEVGVVRCMTRKGWLGGFDAGISAAETRRLHLGVGGAAVTSTGKSASDRGSGILSLSQGSIQSQDI
jgi:hypothetical protein